MRMSIFNFIRSFFTGFIDINGEVKQSYLAKYLNKYVEWNVRTGQLRELTENNRIWTDRSIVGMIVEINGRYGIKA